MDTQEHFYQQSTEQSVSLTQQSVSAAFFNSHKQITQNAQCKSSLYQFIDVPHDCVLKIFEFVVFPLNRYLKPIFFPEQMSNHYYNNVMNNITPSNSQYSYASAGKKAVVLKRQQQEQQEQLLKLLYGVFTFTRPNQTPPGAPVKRERTRSNPLFLWKNVDVSIKSYYYQDHEPLTGQQLQSLCSFVKDCNFLNFSGHQQFTDRCLEILTRQNKRLKCLDVRNTKVDIHGLQYLLKKQDVASQIKTLKISWLSRTQLNENNMHMFGVVDQSAAMAVEPAPGATSTPKPKVGYASQLTHLEVINNSLNEKAVRALLQYNNFLRVLNLSHNPLRDDGAIALSACVSLRELYLEDCEITDRGAYALIPSTGEKPVLPNLQKLDLSHNVAITEASLARIGTSPLQYIKLTDTNISDGAGAFLAKNNTLKVLILDYTKIGNDGVKNMLMALDPASVPGTEEKYQRTMTSLTTLNVRQTKINKNIIQDLKKHIGAQLKHLTLLSDFS